MFTTSDLSDLYLGKVITAFEGGIVTRIIDHPHNSNRAFTYEVTFHLQHPRILAVARQKPPLHFHPYQEEYIEVLQGCLAVEVDGVEQILSRGDGEFNLRPWTHHRLYSPITEVEGKEDKTVFLLSGQDTDEMFRLDTVFFENWYAYQDLIVMNGKKFDLIQVMSMFDAGGSYLSLPRWIPFNRTIARGMGIVVGRWVGGLLGYQPFFRQWTTDWELACRKMETSMFYRWFANGGHEIHNGRLAYMNRLTAGNYPANRSLLIGQGA